MEEIRALHESSGPTILQILIPSCNIFAPRLQKNRDAILSVKRTTETYGPHPRQKLDIYLPSDAPDAAPILLFAYGGGLTGGDKIVPDFMIPDGLMYHNLGAFFANRGFRVVIPDYRRVNSERGGEDAVFPSGAEDLSLAIKWVQAKVAAGTDRKTDMFLMGNSAGGLHACTFLLEPRYLEQRKELATGAEGLLLQGFIDLSVPHHFKSADQSRALTNETYFGSPIGIESRCPYGLLATAIESGKSKQELAVPRTLVLVDEFDPEDEISETINDFVNLWKKGWGQDDLSFQTIEGHNHFTPVAALMSGVGEAWGEDVVKWMKQSQ
ncbi:hypothetical protein PVAG01_01738 [Phlyctema vagabunda]|uniref:BD-FAE-like domain-containing protein n=1 Tax=Phlyctema vagabunda TaxID=108571 RepID=A0ABR4PYG8_9HELO